MIKLFIALMFCCSALYSQETIRIITTEYPPYQYQNGSQIEGISAETVKAIFVKAGLKQEMEILPWARADVCLNTQKTFFFNLSRTDQRENKYQWIAAITPNTPYLWKLKSRTDIKITKFEDLKSLIIGVLPNDVNEEYLTNKGVPKMQFSRVSKNQQNIEMLFYGRIDLAPMDETMFRFVSKKLGYSDDMFEKAYILSELNSESYLVASLSVPKTIIKQLQYSFKILQNNGSINKIRLKYIENHLTNHSN